MEQDLLSRTLAYLKSHSEKGAWTAQDYDYELALAHFLAAFMDGEESPAEQQWQAQIRVRLGWSQFQFQILRERILKEPNYDLSLFKVASEEGSWALILYEHILELFDQDPVWTQEEANFLAKFRLKFLMDSTPEILELETRYLQGRLSSKFPGFSLEQWYQSHGVSSSATPEAPEVEELSVDELLAQLDQLVGLEEVKSEVQQIVSFLKVQKARAEHELPPLEISLHMVYTGNPGTGKTTVARLMARILKALGVLRKGHLIETDRSGLVGQYVGHTEQKTKDLITKALGGVLFIDEAYALYKGSENDYGQEAIDSLVKWMEDYRQDLVVIVAGYQDEMQEFIEANPGLRSRFNTWIDFQNYKVQDLSQIFNLLMAKHQFELEASAQQQLEQVIQQALDQSDRSFGNGRYVRNLFERVLKNQSLRLANSDLGQLTRQELSTLKAQDIIQ